ncbi:MAG TPA: tetratricopeptide repeat protein [Anaerolineales bacterium]|nr:tetratricopeptide repeat protein [Anaerolineales bacterium]
MDGLDTPLFPHINQLNSEAWNLASKDRARAVELATEARQLAQTNDPPYALGIVESLQTLSRVNLFAGEYEQALKYGLEGLVEAESAQIEAPQVMLLNTISSCYRMLGNLPEALQHGMRQVELCQRLGDETGYARALTVIATVYADMDEYTKGVSELEKCLPIFRTAGDAYFTTVTLNNLAYMSHKAGQTAQAIARGQEALEAARQLDERRVELVVHNTLAEMYLDSGDSAKALEELEPALQLLAAEVHPDLHVESNYLQGMAYTQQGKMDQAIQSLEKAIELGERIGTNRFIYLSYKALSEVYKTQSRFDLALAHYECFHTYERTQFHEENQKKLRNLEVMHKTQEALREADRYALQLQAEQAHRRLLETFNEQLEQEVSRQTEDLRRAYEKLERLDKTKSDFISVTAHELRTPVTVLSGFSQMLKSSVPPELQATLKPLVDGIKNGTDRINDVVKTMLLMLKVDTHALNILSEPINLGSVLSECAINLYADVQQRKQKLALDYTGLNGLPEIHGDRDVLAVVFSHIIVNAIKYTPDGGQITIKGVVHSSLPDRVPRAEEGIRVPVVEITIQDTGIGITPENLEVIFEKFYRGESAMLHSSGKTSFKGGGPGLGLAIARGIVEAHHGRLWAESPGHDEEKLPGSTFHILLPVRQE